MALRIAISDLRISVYREKWHALALPVLACAASIGVALVFTRMGMHQQAFSYLGAVFGFAGVALLVQIPRFVRKLLKDNGEVLLSLDPDGLQITHGFNGSARCYPWSSVSEVVFVKKLRLIHSDETTQLRHALIVFLVAGEVASEGWVERLKSGLAKTAHGRLYYLTSYPSDGHKELLDAFQKMAPSTSTMRFEPWLRFVTFTGELSDPSEHN